MRSLMAILVGILTAYILFPTLFKSKEEFIDCIKDWLGSYYPFSKDQLKDYKGDGSDFKMLFWLLASIGMGYGTYSFF